MNEDIFSAILEFSKAQALHDLLVPTPESIYKSFCRTYSKKFSTPLYLVYQMDFQEVCEAVFSDQFDSLDVVENIETILDRIYTLEDPAYTKRKEEDMSEFIKIAEAREAKRMQKGKKVEPKPELKKGGSVNFGGMLNEGGSDKIK